MNKIISLKEAKERGLNKYFTGKPCKYNHISYRYTINNVCIMCRPRQQLKHRNSPKYKNTVKNRYKNLKKNDPAIFLYDRAFGRAKRNNIKFNLTIDYVRNLWPRDSKCPALGIELKINDKYSTKNSPTLDRINPQKGYIIGNVAIISNAANMIKTNSLDSNDLRKVADWMDNND